MTQNSELIELVYRETGADRRTVKEVITAYWQMLESSLLAGEDVEITGIGRFRLFDIKGRVCTLYNGERYWVPDHKRVSFKPAPKLRKKIREEFDDFSSTPEEFR